MLNQSTAIARLFWQGAHKALLQHAYDAPESAVSAEDLAWVVGALVFVGRLEEAFLLLEARRAELPVEVISAATFFLGIGSTRTSAYADARRLFARNVRLARTSPSPFLSFFAHQGLAFYRFFRGRMGSASVSAQRALDASVKAQFTYGKVLAYDLEGHASVRLGNIARGLGWLSTALEIARALGDGGLCQTIGASVAIYRARHGADVASNESRLRALAEADGFENTYTKADLWLECARLERLKGDLDAAASALERASALIHGGAHRRQKITLLHGLAHHRLLEGQAEQARSAIDEAFALLDRDVDAALERALLGLICAHAPQLGIGADDAAFAAQEERLRWLTTSTGEAIGKRIAARNEARASTSRLLSPNAAGRDDPLAADDAIGALLDALNGAQASEDVFSKALSARLFGLLRGVLNEALLHRDGEIQVQGALDTGCAVRAIVSGLVPGHLVVFDRGRVHVSAGKVSPLLQALCASLAQSDMSGEEIIARHWQLVYHPLRHDAIVYRSISRLRAALGVCGHWVESLGGRYRLMEGVSFVRALRFPRSLPRSQELNEISAPGEGGARVCVPAYAESTPHPVARPVPGAGPYISDLNERQHAILNLLKQRPSVDVADCIETFGVSRATASRDLTGLLRSGRLMAMGKGRSTRYTIPVTTRRSYANEPDEIENV